MWNVKLSEVRILFSSVHSGHLYNIARVSTCTDEPVAVDHVYIERVTDGQASLKMLTLISHNRGRP